MSLTIYHFLENSAHSNPHKTAVIHGVGRTTYRQINDHADNLAGFLRAKSMRRGDRIALLMENSVDYIISYYGILKAGAVAAPLNPGLKPEGLQHLIDNLEPAAIITSYKSEHLLRAVSLNTQHLKYVIIRKPKHAWRISPIRVAAFEECISDQGQNLDLDTASKADDLASIVYTSGSTGRPKGVMLSHGNIVSNTLSICNFLRLTSDDIQMVVLPFFYVMGKSLLHTLIAVTGTVVINNRFLYSADVVKQMADEKITSFSGVPSTYAYLLHRSPLAKYRDLLPSLRYCTQAGGHMPLQLKKDLRSALPAHTKIVIMYGATEASARLSYLEPGQFENKMSSIGRAIPGVELKIVNDAGQTVEDGKTGELLAKGPNIMKGYWRDPEYTRLAIDLDGYYHTGDTAFKDKDGYFYTTGRKDNILKVKGHKVNPREIEECLMQTQKLIEAAVIGVPDPLSGHRLVALYVPTDNSFDKGELEKHCRQVLPRHQVPSEFIFLKSLPKSGSGKIDNQKCISAYQAIKPNLMSM